MNHIYRTIWNQKTGTCVAVSELAKSSSKKASAVCGEAAGVGAGRGITLKTMAASLLMATAAPLYALPTDGVVTAGSATISSAGDNMTINQSSQNVALNWQSFSIGESEAVRFVQLNSNSVALNRVLGADPSGILGSLSANGQVFLVNPNGILFGQGASVNVGGLVASTQNISDSDFMAGDYNFAGSTNAAVLNQGRINADGGYVALLGRNVANHGVIAARMGTVALAAGEAIILDMMGDGLLNVSIDQGAVNALVVNGGLIQADGGQVLISAQSAGNLLNTVVNNTGVIQAHTIENRDGVIRLLGDMQTGTVNVAGTLDASAPTGGDGGFIDTSAATVTVTSGTKVTTAATEGLTGTWLIDPTDFTIAAGSGTKTGSSMGADTLSSNLSSNNVRIETVASGSENGDIHVNSAVSWSANELTLSAHGDINIHATLNGSDTAKLALEYGQSAVAAGNTADYHVNTAVNLAAGDNFSTKLGSDGSTLVYTVVTSLGVAVDTGTTSLQGMSNNLAGRYVLGSDIDASDTSNWNDGAGFNPIGLPPANNRNLNHFSGTFDGLGHRISGLTINRAANYVGLFGYVDVGSSIRNIGLLGGSVTAQNINFTGGHIGSLVGFNEGAVSRAFATGTVTGSDQVGGLVGNNQNKKGTITQSFATGQVTGSGNSVGGLVGYNGHTISQSYATGGVTNTGTGGQGQGGRNTGGLVGQNYFHNTQASGNISQSYATGAVVGVIAAGGLVGANNGTVNTSYWNTETSGQATSAGGTGLTTAELMQLASFSNWNDATPNTIANTGGSGAVWRIYEGHTAPLLRSFMTNLTLTGAPDLAVTYNGTTQTGAGISVPSGVLGAAATGTNVGFYNGYYSTQQGYDISGGNLTINPVPLTVISLNGTRAYDGTTDVVAGIFTLSGLVNGQDLNLTGTGTVGSKNVGTYTVSLGSLTLGDGASGLASNYTFAGGTHTATITKADLTVTGLSTASRIYDGTDVAVLGGAGAVAKFGADDVTLTGTVSGKFADKHVGLGKSVTVSGNSLEGADAGNYNLLQATGLTAAITKADLSLSASVITKTYDGGLSASGTATVSSGTVFDGDEISGGSFAFTDKNVGSGNKTVIVSDVTVADGNNGDNYNVSYTSNATSTINPYAVSLTGSRIYDGAINVSAGALTIGALVGTETLTLSGAGTVADKHVANARSLTLDSLALGDGANGGLASNYTFTGGTQTVDITPAALTLSTTDVSRVYDGGLTAAGTAIVTGGTLFGADLVSGGSFAFTDNNVGSGNKVVTVSGVTVADGNNGGNYNVRYTNNATSTINPYAVSLTGSRIYDGTVNVSAGALTIGALVGTETLTLSGAGTVADKHVANARSLTLDSLALGDGMNGGLVSNYTFTGGTQTVDITPAALTLSTTDVSRVYDGGLTAAGTAIVTGGTLFGADMVSGGNFAFTDPNIGVGDKVVTVSGVTVADGNNGGNYNVSYADNTTSSIVKPVLSDASIILLQNSRATATSSGSASEAPGANPALSGFSLARLGTGSLAGLGDILVSQGIRLPTDLQPGSADDDDDSDNDTN